MTPRYRPITRNGRTHHIPTPGPRPPRDLDKAVLTAVTAGTALLVTVSVAWSTASIGDLLSRAVVQPLAYGAASAFDLAWIIAMAIEWLARYDPERAETPRRAGHVFLALAMAGVGVHGLLAGSWATAAVGAAVSALAKGGWTLVMRHQAIDLDGDTAAWLRAERAARGAARALAVEDRVDARAAGQLAALRNHLALPGPDADPEPADADPEPSGDPADDPDPSPLLSLAGRPTVLDAVRTAVDSGITDPEAVLRYVRKVSEPKARQATVDRYLRDPGQGRKRA